MKLLLLISSSKMVCGSVMWLVLEASFLAIDEGRKYFCVFLTETKVGTSFRPSNEPLLRCFGCDCDRHTNLETSDTCGQRFPSSIRSTDDESVEYNSHSFSTGRAAAFNRSSRFPKKVFF